MFCCFCETPCHCRDRSSIFSKICLFLEVLPREIDADNVCVDPIDAILLPLFAGISLASLYFLIKWLEDPALLNKVLNWYFAFFGVWSLARMIRDSMSTFTSFVRPKIYDKDGRTLEIHDNQRESKLNCSPSVEQKPQVLEPSAASPLSSKVIDTVSTVRELLLRQLDVRVYVHKTVQAKFKIGLQGITSLFIAVVGVLYFNFIGKPWWLTNLLGFSFAYSALQIMSPTTSWTGTLILGALFIYDIYFVFFTPLMVAVATQLDIPAKLVFPRPSRPNEDPTKQALFMLGLGDIILPGMMIAFALRFDLYLFYLRKQTQPTINQPKSLEDAANDSASEEAIEPTKATWHPATGGWGERFWYSKDDILRSKRFRGVIFPKTYFRASVIGYFLGMLCTLGVMEIYGHAQPALLYLVPGVLGSMWGTALFKGDMKVLWNFDEAQEEREAEARSGKEKEHSFLNADHGRGFDWKHPFLTILRTLNLTDQPKNVDQNENTNGQAKNGRIEKPKNTKSIEDLSEKFERSSSSGDESTRSRSNSHEPRESKKSRVSENGRKEDKGTKAFARDRKSELIFISVNLAKAAPPRSSETTSIPEQETSSAHLGHETHVNTMVEDYEDDGLGETY